MITSIEQAKIEKDVLLKEVLAQILDKRKLGAKDQQLLYDCIRSVKKVDLLILQNANAVEADLRRNILAEKNHPHDEHRVTYQAQKITLAKQKAIQAQLLDDLSHNLDYFREQIVKQRESLD
jgi:hypothetical protein